MPNPKKRERRVEEGSPQWMVTYGDMTTLLLTFFILMFTTAEIDGAELRMILAAFQGLGTFRGGNTLQVGKLAELGHTIMSLPSREAGKGTGLGLSICHGIVSEHGGQIYAKSQGDKGTTIFVELPINSHDNVRETP